jgi:CRP/FNR family transcriptional regulator
MSLNVAPPQQPSTDVVELLARALPGARHESHEWLADNARLRRVAPREMIFRQGDPIPMTLVVDGHGAFRRTTKEGRELLIGLAAPGFMFGFSGLSVPNSRTDFFAVTNGQVALWPADHLRVLADRDPGLAVDVIEQMGQFIAGLTARLDGFLHQDARRRVLRILAEHEEVFFGDSPVLTRAHLPSLVGTSREMTSRVIRELEREGVVLRVGRSGLRLLSPERLLEAPARPSDQVT